jgi:hypothetical protein
MEIKILIEAPELAAAVNNLATAVSNFGEIKVQPVINTADVADKAVKQTRRRKSDKSAAEEVPAQVEAPGVQTPDAPATAPVEPPHTVPSPAPVPPLTPASEAPVTEQPQPRQYTMQDIAKVGAALLDKGMMPQLSAILNEMGVMAIPQLRPEQYPVVVEKLIALGGKFD